MQEKYYRHHNESIWEILPVGHCSMIVPKDEFSLKCKSLCLGIDVL